jgi:hypothetical protein
MQDILKSANIMTMVPKAQHLRDSSIDPPDNTNLVDELTPFPPSVYPDTPSHAISQQREPLQPEDTPQSAMPYIG